MKKKKITEIIIILVTIALYFFGSKEICDILATSCQFNVQKENKLNLNVYDLNQMKNQKIALEEIPKEKNDLFSFLEEKDQETIQELLNEDGEEWIYFKEIKKDKQMIYIFYNPFQQKLYFFTKQIALT